MRTWRNLGSGPTPHKMEAPGIEEVKRPRSSSHEGWHLRSCGSRAGGGESFRMSPFPEDLCTLDESTARWHVVQPCLFVECEAPCGKPRGKPHRGLTEENADPMTPRDGRDCCYESGELFLSRLTSQGNTMKYPKIHVGSVRE